MAGHSVPRWWRSADGLALHARDHAAMEGPARPPVVCLHGLTRNSRDFDALAPWLAARGRRVLALDVRGRGLSARDPQADYRIPTYAADVIALLGALGIARAHFIGTSMGGMIAMELAATRGDMIAGAIVNDIGPVLGEAGLRRIAAYVGKAVAIDSWEAAADHLRRLNEAVLPRYRAADWAAMARRLFCEKEGRIEPDYDPAIARALAEGPLIADPWGRWEQLATGRPVLLLRGGLSDLLDHDTAARMVTGRANVVLCTVPDVGHAPMLDEPVALDAIGKFFSGNP